ncbi:MAG: VOC family protein [Burkholderiaceae bacterium]
MKCTQYYPVIQTLDVAASSAFYQQHFGFEPAFDSDWYVHLQLAGDPAVNLALVQAEHETVPKANRGVTSGLILSFEVADATQEFERLTELGLDMASQLKDEAFGQRHFMVRDPNGILIDIIEPIEPSAEFLEQYRTDAVPQ